MELEITLGTFFIVLALSRKKKRISRYIIWNATGEL